MNLLIVDDREVVRQALRGPLEKSGYNIDEAADGAEALEVLNRKRFDAVISDLLMPNVDGYVLCRKIRQNPQTSTLPIIIYSSAYLSPADEQLALDAGADIYLPKPCAPGELLAAVKEITTNPKYQKRRAAQSKQDPGALKEYNEELVNKIQEKNSELRIANDFLVELERKATDRARQTEAVSKFGQLALAGEGIQSLFEKAADLLACELGAEFTNVLELLPDGQSLLMRAGVGWQEGLVGRAKIRAGSGTLAGHVLQSKQAVVVSSMSADDRFPDARFLHDHGVVSGVAVLFESRSGPLGLVGVFSRVPKRFSEGDALFVQSIANILGLAAERKRIEDEARRARRFAENIVDTIREPLLVLDETLRVITASSSFCRCFRVSVEETEGKIFYNLGEDQWNIPVLRKLLDEICLGGGVFNDYEVTHVFPVIGRRTMLLNARRLQDDTGGPIMILLAMEDVTERKRAEETLKQKMVELARSNADLEQYAYVASHDLQEPLRAIGGCVELLLSADAQKYGDREKELIGHILEGVGRMKALINDLIAYARISGPRSLEQADCNKVVESAVRNLGLAIEESGARVTHESLPTLGVDAGQLAQLFQNLIGNAIKFRGQRPPEIHISAALGEGEWQFSVRDNGIGISPQYAERIFNLFQRLHARGKYPGTGIGLAICKKIVERHGGRIWVESEPSQGANFCFTLPLHISLA